MKTLQHHANRLKELSQELRQMAGEISNPKTMSSVYSASTYCSIAANDIQDNINDTLNDIKTHLDNLH